MLISALNGGVLVEGSDIDLRKTFDCGQCFRFERAGEDAFRGVAFGRVLQIRVGGDGSFFVSDMSVSEFSARYTAFFDLESDYAGMRKRLASAGLLPEALKNGDGIHILRQDFWETLCSFIIAQNNNIPRIRKIIGAFCRLLGDEIDDGVYAFPTAEKTAAAGSAALAPVRAGYRAAYIAEAAEKAASGALSEAALRAAGLEEATKALRALNGVGPKTAACVALFSLGYGDAFPVDVWMRRALRNRCAEGFSPRVFGSLAGLAQQYLFYNERYFSSQRRSAAPGSDPAPKA